MHTDLITLLTPGSPMTDKHINLAQTPLRKQFPKLTGLQQHFCKLRQCIATGKKFEDHALSK